MMRRTTLRVILGRSTLRVCAQSDHDVVEVCGVSAYVRLDRLLGGIACTVNIAGCTVRVRGYEVHRHVVSAPARGSREGTAHV